MLSLFSFDSAQDPSPWNAVSTSNVGLLTSASLTLIILGRHPKRLVSSVTPDLVKFTVLAVIDSEFKGYSRLGDTESFNNKLGGESPETEKSVYLEGILGKQDCQPAGSICSSSLPEE